MPRHLQLPRGVSDEPGALSERGDILLLCGPNEFDPTCFQDSAAIHFRVAYRCFSRA